MNDRSYRWQNTGWRWWGSPCPGRMNEASYWYMVMAPLYTTWHKHSTNEWQSLPMMKQRRKVVRAPMPWKDDLKRVTKIHGSCAIIILRETRHDVDQWRRLGAVLYRPILQNGGRQNKTKNHEASFVVFHLAFNCFWNKLNLYINDPVVARRVTNFSEWPNSGMFSYPFYGTPHVNTFITFYWLQILNKVMKIK